MRLKYLSLIIFTAFFALSCKKSFLDVNKDPNNLSGTVSPSLIFTNALSQTVNNMVAQNEQGSYLQANGHNQVLTFISRIGLLISLQILILIFMTQYMIILRTINMLLKMQMVKSSPFLRARLK